MPKGRGLTPHLIKEGRQFLTAQCFASGRCTLADIMEVLVSHGDEENEKELYVPLDNELLV